MDLKTTLAPALLLACIQIPATAGTYSPPECLLTPVTLPCAEEHWEAGFEGFYVKATASIQNYLTVSTLHFASNSDSTTLPSMSMSDRNTTNQSHKVEPEYALGFELNLAYHWDTEHALRFAWQSLHDANHDETNLNPEFNIRQVVSTSVAAFIESSKSVTIQVNQLLPLTQEPGASHFAAWHHYHFDTVALSLSQTMHAGADVDMAVNFGLNYLDLRYIKKVHFDGAVTGRSTTVAVDQSVTVQIGDSNFIGLAQGESEIRAGGVHLGMDGRYALPEAMHLIAHADLALFYGEIRSQLDSSLSGVTQERTFDGNGMLIIATPPVQVMETSHFRFNDVWHVVPAITLKAGVQAQCLFTQGLLQGELGWRWQTYQHVLRFEDLTFENFSFQGPYIAAKYIG